MDQQRISMREVCQGIPGKEDCAGISMSQPGRQSGIKAFFILSVSNHQPCEKRREEKDRYQPIKPTSTPEPGGDRRRRHKHETIFEQRPPQMLFLFFAAIVGFVGNNHFVDLRADLLDWKIEGEFSWH
jgi:hypothetical protein